MVQEGDSTLEGDGTLEITRGIEVGHIFQLGTKYSESMEAFFTDENQARQPLWMGCYGLGVTRTLQAIIEYSHDDNGIIWPVSVAPYTVCVTPLDIKPESEVMQAAVKIHDELASRGVDVLLDDRDERPGSKFKDSELIGIPVRVAVGGKSLTNGEVELTIRHEGGKTPIPVEEAVERVLALL